MRSSGRRRLAVAVALVVAAALLTASPAVGRGAPHIDPAALPRGDDPSVAYLVRDTIRDGDRRVPATTRGRHEALWVVAGGYVVRDYNVGPRRRVVLTFVSRAGERRRIIRSRNWIEARVSPSGRRLAIQSWPGSLQVRSVVSVVRPRSGRTVARRELRLATLAAVTDSRVLLGRRAHWRDPATQWWNYRRDTLRRIHGQAAIDADTRQDKVVLSAPRRGEFCNRVAVLSRPSRTLWRSCRLHPHQWTADGEHVVAAPVYFDAAGTDRWWVADGRTGRRQATITGRLDWHAVWEDDAHFLTLAQSDAGRAAILRCDLSGACERASRIWRVPLPAEPSLYYAPPPVVLADR
ncbi:hypothetical protein E8D34_12515 [Nocardioides sp. GY 10113]|uniref:hypothetical protein n=1 Tax=Nocardioides sp. GY 10113 TaxID=2569761 RepID=UPI0010A8B06F|nr:hypothetical protein [Nocardioides sp. GY 10113]TIC85917.1 hypothetical protein E8D34_12515 [Nocardioides sp. GY 10113]